MCHLCHCRAAAAAGCPSGCRRGCCGWGRRCQLGRGWLPHHLHMHGRDLLVHCGLQLLRLVDRCSCGCQRAAGKAWAAAAIPAAAPAGLLLHAGIGCSRRWRCCRWLRHGCRRHQHPAVGGWVELKTIPAWHRLLRCITSWRSVAGCGGLPLLPHLLQRLLLLQPGLVSRVAGRHTRGRLVLRLLPPLEWALRLLRLRWRGRSRRCLPRRLLLHSPWHPSLWGPPCCNGLKVGPLLWQRLPGSIPARSRLSHRRARLLLLRLISWLLRLPLLLLHGLLGLLPRLLLLKGVLGLQHGPLLHRRASSGPMPGCRGPRGPCAGILRRLGSNRHDAGTRVNRCCRRGQPGRASCGAACCRRRRLLGNGFRGRPAQRTVR